MTQPRTPAQQAPVAELLMVLRRRKWLILQAIVFVPIVAYVVSSVQPARYEAAAEVLLSRNNLGANLLGVTDPLVYQDPVRLAQTQARLARIPAVAERAVEQAKVPGATAGGLLGASSVSPTANADLLRFAVQDEDPTAAAKLATAYANAFTEYRSDLDTSAIEQARQELKGRIAELEASDQQGSELYGQLVEREQQLRTLELLQTTNRVVQPAGTGYQVAPRPMRNAALGLVAGIMIALGLAFLAERLDKRVQSDEEIELRLGLPLLARVPEPSRKMRSRDELAMITAPAGHHAEAYRRLRTSIEFVTVEREAKMLMVTSAVQREGKSTTVANLAVAFARAGKKVVIVDLDLRRPYLHRFFALADRPGISEVVLGHATLSQAVVPVPLAAGDIGATGNGNGAAGTGALGILPAGTLPPSPGEFVGTKKLAGVLERIRAEADLVLVDTPPLLAVGDAAVLSAHVDGLLLVTRLTVLKRPMLRELERALGALPAPPLGVVVTGADGASEYGYGYVYGSGKADQAGQATAQVRS